jgi:hypothetical protein
MNKKLTKQEKLGVAPSDSVDVFTAQVIEEEGNEIKYRTLSWQKATLLLFGEYVCLAILSLSWSWSVIGYVSRPPAHLSVS